MQRESILVFAMLLLVTQFGPADVPAGFSWSNLESDTTTMAAVRHALHDPSITAIREVGVEDGFALIVLMTDLAEDNNEELVFAVITQPKGSFAVGSWVQSRDAKTGKIGDDVERYSIDPATAEDRVEKLDGQAALSWEREICTESNISAKPSTGQDSKACRSVLRASIPNQPAAK
ncbi:MAG: hypothetical protein ABSB60_05740 [Terracidiphilus sp.]|jgi:hypothetical protein